MLPHNISSKQSNKDEDQSMGGGSGGDGGGSGGRSTSSMKPPEQILKCPRCDSPNTKFCYYNNYNMAQPRHFCKACKRYWTKGGALRNVPIGGSCRKNKKTKPYSKYSSSDVGGMKMFGLSTLDFQLGGLNFPPRVTAANQLCSSYLVNLDPLGYNDNNNYNNNIVMGTSNNHVHHNSNLASSIESLSSINQDLHWKLQQQRFSLLFGGDDGGGSNGGSGEKLQPILFQNLETSKAAQSSMDGDSSGCGLATECFFDKNYVAANRNPTISANSDGAGNDQNGSMDEWNGIQSWNQYRDGLSYED